MNMFGNFGSFVSASVFPLMQRGTGDAGAYFSPAAALNCVPAGLWPGIKTARRLS